MHHAATAITAPDTDHLPAYWQFHDAVAQAQLLAWLPRGQHMIVDVSGPRSPGGELAAMAGHHVLRVIDAGAPASQRAAGAAWTDERGTSEKGPPPKAARPAPPPKAARPAPPPKAARPAPPPKAARPARRRLKGGPEASGKILSDSSRLSFLPDECADDVLAEDRALSTHLGAEAMIAEIARVLRPAGRVLACVDSLVLGMAVLADQNHWAHLVDLPYAEVVLVPWPDGTITRCYGPDQARELFTGAGLTVNWIRPRTVFSESMVTHVLRRDPGSLAKLVRAELAARSDESLGAQLLISAVKKG